MMSKHQAAASIDVALCFVPQWCPFQPPLSLPSLSAWVRRANFSADIVDANIGFFDFLLSERCASILLSQDLPEPRNAVGREKRRAAREAVASWKTYRDDIDRLLKWKPVSHEICTEMRVPVLTDTYNAVRSLISYLDHVSALSPRFVISPYAFRSRRRSAKSHDVENFVDNPPELLWEYVSQVAEQMLRNNPRIVGLSCIGFSQLIFTLLIGRAIKQRTDVPIVVGGSIFPRLLERGTLPHAWLGKYFDVIVQNEGEKPLEALLRAETFEADSLRQIPGIVFVDGEELVSTPAAALLKPSEVPAPDFDGMPLSAYITSKVAFPIIASRGCYWGKCEFCHIAVEKYSNYKAPDVIATIQLLREKHGASFFLFRDYAIPPSILRRLGRELPHDQTIFMGGLIKFEKYFQAEDFTNAYKAGFRLLSVGLESASERVLALMKKNSTREIMLDNLGDGTAAGLWMHCFVLFGFPGEQAAEAEETTEFMMEHRDIIGSFQAGRFELEHAAPILDRAKQHGVTPLPRGEGDISVYYDYEVDGGVGVHDAMRFVKDLNDRADRDRKYGPTAWISQQHLVGLLSLYSPDDLVDACAEIMDRQAAIPPAARSAGALHPVT